jgi:hypothetical protein
MLRHMNDMPTGTLGFEAVGEVDDDDWEDVVEPQLRSRLAAGEDLRVLYVFGPAGGDLDGDALSAGAEFRARHATSFKRVAIVSDEDWTRPALRMMSFLLPGGTRAFPVRDLAAAKAWVADGG